MRRPLARGLGFGLAASGPAWAGLYGSPPAPDDPVSRRRPVPTVVVGPGADGAVVPTGPRLALSGITEFKAAFLSRSTPVTEAEQVFVDAALALQPARCAVRGWCSPWWMAGGKPAIRTVQHARCASPFCKRRDNIAASETDRRKRPPAHAAFHRGHVTRVFDHDLAAGALGDELVGCFHRCTHRLDGPAAHCPMPAGRGCGRKSSQPACDE